MVKAIWVAYKENKTLRVGITTDTFAAEGRTVPVRPWAERAKTVDAFLHEYVRELMDAGTFEHGIRVSIEELDHKYDLLDVMADDVLVVSKETEESARKALKYHDAECRLIVIPMQTDENGKEIHSTQIVLEEMKRKEGNE